MMAWRLPFNLRMCFPDMLLDVFGVHDEHLADNAVLGELTAEDGMS